MLAGWHERLHAGKLYVSLGSDLFGGAKEQRLAHLDSLLSRYGSMTDIEIKRAAYMTAPMRSILRAERLAMAKLYNAPLDLSLAALRRS
jgi:hypothetical protein